MKSKKHKSLNQKWNDILISNPRQYLETHGVDYFRAQDKLEKQTLLRIKALKSEMNKLYLWLDRLERSGI